MKLSWHDYQLSMSLGIKCLWNHRMKFSIESGCFIQVSFHFKWRGSLGNNVMKLSIEIGLRSVSILISCLSFQRIYILKTVQKSFIPMKLSLLPWNSYHLSLHSHSAMSAYLMSMKLYEIPIETGLSISCLQRTCYLTHKTCIIGAWARFPSDADTILFYYCSTTGSSIHSRSWPVFPLFVQHVYVEFYSTHV
jgi:hypothetical protein